MKIEIGEFKKDLSSIIKAFFYGYRKLNQTEKEWPEQLTKGGQGYYQSF
jgi:hypothetical protein